MRVVDYAHFVLNKFEIMSIKGKALYQSDTHTPKIVFIRVSNFLKNRRWKRAPYNHEPHNLFPQLQIFVNGKQRDVVSLRLCFVIGH